MKIRLIDMLNIVDAENNVNKIIRIFDNGTEMMCFKGNMNDIPFKFLKLEVVMWCAREGFFDFKVNTGKEKVYTYMVHFVSDDMSVSVEARNDAEAVEVGNNLNWKDGKKRTVKSVERW